MTGAIGIYFWSLSNCLFLFVGCWYPPWRGSFSQVCGGSCTSVSKQFARVAEMCARHLHLRSRSVSFVAWKQPTGFSILLEWSYRAGEIWTLAMFIRAADRSQSRNLASCWRQTHSNERCQSRPHRDFAACYIPGRWAVQNCSRARRWNRMYVECEQSRAHPYKRSRQDCSTKGSATPVPQLKLTIRMYIYVYIYKIW